MDLYPGYHLFFRNIILSSLQVTCVSRSRVHCSVLCSMASSCSSFFYNNVNHDCYLVDRFVLPGGSGREPRNNIAYYVNDVSPCPSDLGFQLELSVNICYKLHWEELVFNTARAVCQEEGGDLATTKTPQIENFYISLLSQYGPDMFFGAIETGTPRTWRWLDGTPCWRSYRKTKSGKHCVEYDYDDNMMDGEFYDQDLGFVCEVVLPPKYE